MKAREIKTGVHWVGAVDWDRRLFDELIPLPDGTSYNAYLVQGSQKTALIDTVDPTMAEVLFARLDSLKVKAIDYVVINHAEQDHSGTLPGVLSKYPQAKVICTPKCKGLLMDLLLIPEAKIITVEDKETVSLGDRTLEFVHAAWVHWPETMLTYLREDKILFSCDLFGAHLATSELYVSDEGHLYESAKRYYAEIMMPFRPNIEKHLARLKEYNVELIAPSHGPLHRRPEFIIKAYHRWVFDPPQNIVVLPYISMHGSTRQMVNYFVEALTQRGVVVKQFELSQVDIGKLAMALVDAATLVIGTPTVLISPHPLVAYATFLANALRPKTRFASIIGSFGWGSRAKETIIDMIPNLKVELLEPVIIKGLPREADFKALDNLAAIIAEKHKGLAQASS
ncbi:MAG: FprA family A-type flavoprotein [Dehalococcoidia bacterium]|nr:MAG: FprA family A-type flavoprotein [Dehalococcoidia bacterium]